MTLSCSYKRCRTYLNFARFSRLQKRTIFKTFIFVFLVCIGNSSITILKSTSVWRDISPFIMNTFKTGNGQTYFKNLAVWTPQKLQPNVQRQKKYLNKVHIIKFSLLLIVTKKNALSKRLTHQCFNNSHPVSIGIAKNSLYMFAQPAKLGLFTSEKKNGEVILQFQSMPR